MIVKYSAFQNGYFKLTRMRYIALAVVSLLFAFSAHGDDQRPQTEPSISPSPTPTASATPSPTASPKAETLSDLVDPINESIRLHQKRLKDIQAGLGSSPVPDLLGLEHQSAEICESYIQNLVEPVYAKIAETKTTLDEKLQSLVDSHKELSSLVSAKLPKNDGKPDSVLFELFSKGSLGATQVAYVQIVKAAGPLSRSQLIQSLQLLNSLRDMR
jgi:hypothetical protein